MQRPRAPNYVAFTMATMLAALGVTAITTKYFPKGNETAQRPAIVQTQKPSTHTTPYVTPSSPEYQIPNDIQSFLKKQGMKVDNVVSGDYDNNGLTEYLIMASKEGEAAFIGSEPGSGGFETVIAEIKNFSRWGEIRKQKMFTFFPGPEVLITHYRSDGKKVLYVYRFYGRPFTAGRVIGDDFLITDLDDDGNMEIIAANPRFDNVPLYQDYRELFREFEKGIYIFSSVPDPNPMIARFYTIFNPLNVRATVARNQILTTFGTFRSKETNIQEMANFYGTKIFNIALMNVLGDNRLDIFLDGKPVDAQSLLRDLYNVDNPNDPNSFLKVISSLESIPASLPGLAARWLVANYYVGITLGPYATGAPGTWQDAYQSSKIPRRTYSVGNMEIDADILARYGIRSSMDPVPENMLDAIRRAQEARNAKLKEIQQIRTENRNAEEMIQRQTSAEYQQEVSTRMQKEFNQGTQNLASDIERANRAAQDTISSAQREFCNKLPILCQPSR